MWKWNIDQLKNYIKVWNGKVLISVAIDNKTSTIHSVEQYLKECGITPSTLLVQQNVSSMGGVRSFIECLDLLKNETGPIFYAHTKGVKYPPTDIRINNIKAWTTALYKLNLCNNVLQILGQHKSIGCFKKNFTAGWLPQRGGWHYSGAFFWIRQDIFRCNWQKHDNDYWAIENYLSLHVTFKEAFEIFHIPDGRDLYWHGIKESEYAAFVDSTRNIKKDLEGKKHCGWRIGDIMA